jgi:hypothetical protein
MFLALATKAFSPLTRFAPVEDHFGFRVGLQPLAFLAAPNPAVREKAGAFGL